MRRLFVSLIVAGAMLLTPIAVSAARPVITFTGVTITSTGAHGVDDAGEAICGWQATITYDVTSNRVVEVDVVSQDQTRIDMARTWGRLDPSGTVTLGPVEQTMFGDEWQWRAEFYGRGGFRTVGPAALTDVYAFTSHACPANGLILATYP